MSVYNRIFAKLAGEAGESDAIMIDAPHLKAHRKVQYHYDEKLYRQRHKIENLFGRIKDRRRGATRYDRCARTFMSAISIAATACFWL